jgi:hypothetical protein
LTSWCDKLASTPSIGVRFLPLYETSANILQALSPMLGRLRKGEDDRFKVVKNAPFEVQINTDDGFAYGVDPVTVFVDFHHSLKAKPVSGGPPVLEMLSHPLPFTQLLPEVSKRLEEIIWLLPTAKSRRLSRAGIVANAQVDNDAVPPGIRRLITYLGRPWKGLLDSFSFQITGQIGESSSYSDRCIHTVIRPEDEEQLMTVTFDWQRVYKSERAIAPASLTTLLNEAQRDALAYFEQLAEGNRFDEELIRRST